MEPNKLQEGYVNTKIVHDLKEPDSPSIPSITESKSDRLDTIYEGDEEEISVNYSEDEKKNRLKLFSMIFIILSK